MQQPQASRMHPKTKAALISVGISWLFLFLFELFLLSLAQSFVATFFVALGQVAVFWIDLLVFTAAQAYAGIAVLRDLRRDWPLLKCAFFHALRVNTAVLFVTAVLLFAINPFSVAFWGVFASVAAYFALVLVSTPTISLLSCFLVKQFVWQPLPHITDKD